MTTGPDRLLTGRVKDILRPAVLRSLAYRRAMRRRYLEANRPRWEPADASDIMAAGSSRRRVLLATNIGGYLNGLTLESTLARALLARGHDVEVLLCDGVLPACLECTYHRLGSDREMAEHGPTRLLCPGCFETGKRTYDEVGARVHSYSSLVTPDDRLEARDIASRATPENVAGLTLDGLGVGEHALAGALRFFARATLDGEPRAVDIVRRYVEAAVLAARATERLVSNQQFDVAVFHHGIYIPQGIVGEVCRRDGLRVVTWNPAYRKRTFVFSHGDTYHHTLLDEPTSTWEELGWDEEREADVMEYLKTRWSGSEDWIWFHERPVTDVSEIEKELGIDFARPTIGLLTNVMWDAQLHYPANAFANMRDWVLETVRWFAAHQDLQLLIRVHPAERTGTVPSRQLIVDEISAEFPRLPPNVFVVGPESHVSTYAAMSRCDSVVIFGTKTGVELASVGIPVIVAGEAWIRGKGVTTDVGSVDEYLRVLGTLPRGRRMDDDAIRRARQYAYHFFFRRMIPLEFMEPTGSDPVFRPNVDGVEPLMPGRSIGLDVIVDGILHGSPFVYPSDSVSRTVSA